MSQSIQQNWRCIFTRVKDDSAGLPRFYIRGTKAHLLAYDGYTGTHQVLNKIFLFMGGHDKNAWTESDSPMNVSTYEYVKYYNRNRVGTSDRIEIFGGNYMCCGKSQGAYIVGFDFFRALITHLGLNPPRKLKGETCKSR